MRVRSVRTSACWSGDSIDGGPVGPEGTGGGGVGGEGIGGGGVGGEGIGGTGVGGGGGGGGGGVGFLHWFGIKSPHFHSHLK